MTTPLDRFRGCHDGASFAILGSSPTVDLYRSEQDIAIGVNGAAIAIHKRCKMDYFMCCDRQSPARRWFLASEMFGATRVVASHVLPFDPIAIPDASERQRLQRELAVFVAKDKQDWRFSLGSYSTGTRHGFFEYSEPWEQRVSREQTNFAKGCTISGMAAQMALIMGASTIHLYGCSFESVAGRHYAYESQGDHGRFKFWHPVVMDFVLSQILRLGVHVFAHGPTALRMVERID